VPFVITTKRPMLRHAEPGTVGVPNRYYPTVLSRHAVATLEDAREACEEIVNGSVNAMRNAKGNLYSALEFSRPLYGAQTIDPGDAIPLPDGTVIEVEAVNSWDLANAVGGGGELAEIIAAYNATQETT
jgi:hypothetical protein